MKKKIYFNIIILVLCFQISGCGKIETDTPTESLPTETKIEDNISSQENILSTAEPSLKPVETADVPEITSKPEKVQISFEQAYSDAYRTVSILGLKEYTKLEGEAYTDKPQKGNIFLVLFLSIRNTTNKEDYINASYISAKVDGKKTEHTFLVNEPKNYPTIFTHVKANKSIGGFIVWEVPESWKKMDVTYDGWKYSNNISINAKFTPKNLSNPKIYNQEDYSY